VSQALVDCGANLGVVLRKFIAQFPDRDFYAFEPNTELHASIRRQVAESGHRHVSVSDRAVWTYDGAVELFLGHHESSTLLPGKWVPPVYDQQIDYKHPVLVPCLDFSAWLKQMFLPGDNVIVKMDIEGAEYPDSRQADAHCHYLAAMFTALNQGARKSPLPSHLRRLKAPGGQLFHWGDLPRYRRLSMGQNPHERHKYIYIVRHGETQENRRGVHQGQFLGGRLSHMGANDAQALGWRLASLSFDSIHVSPAARCQATIGVLRRYVSTPSIRTDVRLDAKNSGYLGGQPRALAAQEAALAGIPIHQFRTPGGESSEEVQARYVNLWREVCEGPSRRALLLGHGGGIACLFLHLKRRPFADYLRYVPGSAAVTVVRVPEAGVRGKVLLMNVSPHDLDGPLLM